MFQVSKTLHGRRPYNRWDCENLENARAELIIVRYSGKDASTSNSIRECARQVRLSPGGCVDDDTAQRRSEIQIENFVEGGGWGAEKRSVLAMTQWPPHMQEDEARCEIVRSCMMYIFHVLY